MMIMPSNNTSGLVHYFAGICRENPMKYKYKIGLLMSPKGWRNPPFYMPYALDNGCFTKWEPVKFNNMLCKIKAFHKPLWCVVPDVVGNAEATIRQWHKWKDKVESFGVKLAFACQDGMEPQDVPKDADCCFIGGTTEWKLKNAHKFKGVCKLLHIGRVNTLRRLKWMEHIGADSVDGTGWLRARGKQYYDFINLFEGVQ
ncbi:MAG: hypothetical protein GY834_10730 [Bacteroidetes bacterium]|nr:hypothetical protein [Bacteroidota bacterium]